MLPNRFREFHERPRVSRKQLKRLGLLSILGHNMREHSGAGEQKFGPQGRGGHVVSEGFGNASKAFEGQCYMFRLPGA